MSSQIGRQELPRDPGHIARLSHDKNLNLDGLTPKRALAVTVVHRFTAVLQWAGQERTKINLVTVYFKHALYTRPCARCSGYPVKKTVGTPCLA